MDIVDIAARIRHQRAGAHLILLLDFDGTLCEFERDPDSVRMTPEVAALLHALAEDAAVTLGVVSGRRLGDLERRLPRRDVSFLVGCHGLDIAGPRGRFLHQDARHGVVAAATLARTVRGSLRGCSGVHLEDKGFGVALHWRNAEPTAARAAEARFRSAAAPHVSAGRLRLIGGDCVLEALPAIDWHKGRAVDWIREQVEARSPLTYTVFVGDDATDEDGFRAVRGRGTAIAASPRPRYADFYVNGPSDVAAFLELMTVPGQSRLPS